MLRTCLYRIGLLASCLFLIMAIREPAAAEDAATYDLKYKFAQGDVLRWEVVHRTNVETTVTDTTKTVQTYSWSIKNWAVTEVKPGGEIVFDHLVEDVDMRQQMRGWQGDNRIGSREARYDSRTDEEVPPGFGDVAKSIGVPLSTVTITPSGQIVARERHKVKAAAQNEGGFMTIPLPEKPVAVGETWSFPFEVRVPASSGVLRRVKTLQKFTLESVKYGIATIHVRTVILTPIDDPQLMSQLIQRLSSGTVKFDIHAGRVASQQMDLDEEVVGMQGRSSSLHYINRFTEQFLPAKSATETVERPTTSPQ